jgi:hypothetical protein
MRWHLEVSWKAVVKSQTESTIMSFIPPAASLSQLSGIPFSEAEDCAGDLKAAYDEFDQTPGNHDPSSLSDLWRRVK